MLRHYKEKFENKIAGELHDVYVKPYSEWFISNGIKNESVTKTDPFCVLSNKRDLKFI